MNMNDKLRPMYIAKILYEQTDEDHFLTTAEIGSILCVDYGIEAYRKTIKADIEALQQFGMDIEVVRASQNKYHVLTRTFSIPELKLLTDAVESSKFITKKKSKELTEKILCLAGKHQAEELMRNIDVEGRIKTENELIYYIVDTINSAINQSKKISFLYFKYVKNKEKKLKNNGMPYVFSPYKLVWNGDYYYMIGYSDKHAGIGMFRIDRMQQVPKILNMSAVKPPEDFNISYYLNTLFRMYDGERKKVKLLCDNEVIDSIISTFSDEIDIEKHSETDSFVTLEVVVNHIFLNWLFGFNGKVIIHEPKEVREMFLELITNCYTKQTNMLLNIQK